MLTRSLFINSPVAKRSCLGTGLLGIAALCVFTSSAFAKVPSVLSIADCSGKPRLTQELAEGQEVSVLVQLESAKDSAMLVQDVSKESLKPSSTVSTSLQFDGVKSGDWMVCGDNNSQVAFKSVSVLDKGSAGSISLKQGGIIGASVASVGAVAVGLSGSTSGSSNSSGRGGSGSSAFESSPSSVDVQPDDRVIETAPGGFNIDDDNDYDFGDEAAPVSPFQ